MSRILIVNADDLGASEAVNRGIFRAHDEGIVTSASLMVRRPGAAHAAAHGRRRPRLALGLHADLGEWIHHDGRWCPVYEVVDTGDPEAVEAEVAHQLECFRSIVGRDPTHLDSHQHVHMNEPVSSALIAVAEALDVPLRRLRSPARHCGDFYGLTASGEPLPDAITVEALVGLLGKVTHGVTELACHPGEDAALASAYSLERLRELQVLCDPRVRAKISAEGIDLWSFADLKPRLKTTGLNTRDVC